MIEAVEQSLFQQAEAATRGSLARHLVAMLIQRKRFAKRMFLRAQAQFGTDHPFTCERNAELTEAHNAAEDARRLLHGLEQ